MDSPQQVNFPTTPLDIMAQHLAQMIKQSAIVQSELIRVRGQLMQAEGQCQKAQADLQDLKDQIARSSADDLEHLKQSWLKARQSTS